MKYTVIMRKARILLILGIWVAILPFLGFPSSWRDVLVTLTGLGIIFFSYVLFKDYKKTENKKETFDSFSENSNLDSGTTEIDIMETDEGKNI